MTSFYQLTPPQQADKLKQLATDALPQWGIEAQQIELIKYRENAVFKIVTNDQKFALRIHRPGYHDSRALRSELTWMAALSKSAFAVPLVIPTTRGELCVSVKTPAVPEPRDIDLFAWVEGETLGRSGCGVSSLSQQVTTYRRVGELAAQLHNQSSTWVIPDDFSRHAWDCEGLVGEQPFWGPFWMLPQLTETQRELIQQARLAVKKRLSTLEQSSRNYSLIHADFVPDNLLQDGDTIRLIDFDDAGFGWHMFELATALFFLIRDPNYPVIKDALFAGYRQHRALPLEDEALLDTFLTARGFTYLGWLMDRSETETAQQATQLHIDQACYQAQKLMS